MREQDFRREDATYVYAVVPGAFANELGPIGLGGATVRALSCGDIAALIHDCPAEPFSGDGESIMEFVSVHNDVVSRAWSQTGSILPMRFGVIVKPDDSHTADENVHRWLEEEKAYFKIKLDELRDKVELGVQLLWDTDVVAVSLAECSDEVRALTAAIAGMSPGAAYLQRHKLAESIKRELERKAVGDYAACYETLSRHADGIHVNKPRKREGKTMIANLALLARKDKVEEIGAALGAFSEEDGVEVRFTGPWPPYTFAAIPVAGESGRPEVDALHAG
ncbi:MAG: GvpL/GvpF family gas vesicle protein [Dehalococcoidia bacterium]|jgi:hypothetical protein